MLTSTWHYHITHITIGEVEEQNDGTLNRKHIIKQCICSVKKDTIAMWLSSDIHIEYSNDRAYLTK